MSLVASWGLLLSLPYSASLFSLLDVTGLILGPALSPVDYLTRCQAGHRLYCSVPLSDLTYTGKHFTLCPRREKRERGRVPRWASCVLSCPLLSSLSWECLSLLGAGWDLLNLLPLGFHLEMLAWQLYEASVSRGRESGKVWGSLLSFSLLASVRGFFGQSKRDGEGHHPSH